MGIARCRLASLWLSQTARVLADNCLRVFVVLELIRAGTTRQEAAWHLVAALLMLPAVLLAPLNGALGNSLPKHRVLVGAAAWCLAAVAFGAASGAWLACWALVAVGAAVYSPTRYALLPAASADAAVPLTRVNGWVETGAVIAIVAGMVLGAHAYDQTWNGWEAAVAAAAALNLLGLVTALPARFPSDVRRPEPPGRALAGFFRDARRVLADREARACLLALAGLRGVVLATAGAILAATLDRQTGDTGGLTVEQLTGAVHELIGLGAWILAGVAAGSLLASVQGHPARALGLVPFGATGLAIGFVVAALTGVPSPGLCLLLGVMAGLVNVPLAAAYQAALPADARGNGMAVRNLTDNVAMAVLSLLLFGLANAGLDAAGQLGLVAALAAAGAAVAWWALYRHAVEQVVELLLWPFYRIRGYGPGRLHLPRRGPLVIVANHAAWFDPMFLAKVLPRLVIPMMTSVYFDLPGIHFIMGRIVGAVRVPASKFRREAPELAEAIAILDRGDVLVIFPEGSLRRREEQPLRLFGQGVWHILSQRPETPVVPCWIEGTWGSFFSYKNGPPTVNKRMDFLRRIDVAADEPRVLDPAVLADHRATRRHLMQLCLDARRLLGLEAFQAEKEDEETPVDEPEAPAPGEAAASGG